MSNKGFTPHLVKFFSSERGYRGPSKYLPQIKPRVLKRGAGFTIIEVLIGLIFLAIGLLAIASLQVTSVRGNFFSNNLMQATYVAQDRLEFLKNSTFTSIELSAGSHPDGTVRIPDIPGGIVFSRSYGVDESDIDGDGNADLKTITYRVTWNDGVDHNISFSTIRSQ